MEREVKRSRVASSSSLLETSSIHEDPAQLHLAPLVSSRFVTAHTRPQVSSLPHVVNIISTFLNSSHKWTLETASDIGYLPLLDRLLTKEWSGVSQHFRRARFLRGIRSAATKGQGNVLVWWCTKYLPDDQPKDIRRAILRVAAFHGHMNVFNGGFFSADESIRMIENIDPPLVCQHPEIIHWVRNQNQNAPLLVLLDHAIAQGDVDFLAWIYGSEPDKDVTTASDAGIRDAAGAGHLEVLKLLHAHDFDLTSEMAMRRAAKAGHLDVMKWLYENDEYDAYAQPNVGAVDNGHFEIVKWMVEKYEYVHPSARLHWFQKAMEAAISKGNQQMIDYLYEHRPSDFVKQGLEKAVKLGDLELVKWLHTNGFESSTDPMEEAAKHGHLSVLQWLYENIPGKGRSKAVMDMAACYNHLHIVQWLHDNQTDGCSKRAMIYAAGDGHLEMVKWLHAYRHEYDKTNNEIVMMDDLFNFPIFAMGMAADAGHLDIVQWLHEHRSHEECGRNAMNQPAANGHVHVLRWLHEHRNEQFTVSGVRGAAANGHCDVLDFLRSLNPDLKCDMNGAASAASQGHFQVIEWLERHEPELAAHVVPEMKHRMMERLCVYADVEQLLDASDNYVDEDYDFEDEMGFYSDEEDEEDDEAAE